MALFCYMQVLFSPLICDPCKRNSKVCVYIWGCQNVTYLFIGWSVLEVPLMLQLHGGLHSPFGYTWCALFHQTLDEYSSRTRWITFTIWLYMMCFIPSDIWWIWKGLLWSTPFSLTFFDKFYITMSFIGRCWFLWHPKASDLVFLLHLRVA